MNPKLDISPKLKFSLPIVKEAIGKIVTSSGGRFMLEQEGDGNVQNDMEDLLNGPSALPKA